MKLPVAVLPRYSTVAVIVAGPALDGDDRGNRPQRAGDPDERLLGDVGAGRAELQPVPAVVDLVTAAGAVLPADLPIIACSRTASAYCSR